MQNFFYIIFYFWTLQKKLQNYYVTMFTDYYITLFTGYYITLFTGYCITLFTENCVTMCTGYYVTLLNGYCITLFTGNCITMFSGYYVTLFTGYYVQCVLGNTSPCLLGIKTPYAWLVWLYFDNRLEFNYRLLNIFSDLIYEAIFWTELLFSLFSTVTFILFSERNTVGDAHWAYYNQMKYNAYKWPHTKVDDNLIVANIIVK